LLAETIDPGRIENENSNYNVSENYISSISPPSIVDIDQANTNYNSKTIMPEES
jgi:hypothetical protein